MTDQPLLEAESAADSHVAYSPDCQEETGTEIHFERGAVEDIVSDDEGFDHYGRARNPRAAKRKRQVKDLVKESKRALPIVDSSEYRHNLQHSVLHTLPAELMLQIAEDMSIYPDLVLTMRLVSRDFYSIFELPFIIGKEERETFKDALRRDVVRWYSTWERFKGLLNLTQAVCCACGCRHHKSQFSADELLEEPEKRRCIGVGEVVNMHGDRASTLNEIRDLGPDESKAGFQKVFISSTTITKSTHDQPVLQTIIGHTFKLRKLHVMRHFRLRTLPKTSCLRKDDLRQLLADIRYLICEDLQEDDVYVGNDCISLRQLQWKIPKHTKFPSLISPYERYRYTWVSCWCWDYIDRCENYYALHRRTSSWNDDLDEIVLSVFSMFEPHAEDANPAWADDNFQKLIDQQERLNEDASGDLSITIYKARGRGEAEWSVAEPEANQIEVKNDKPVYDDEDRESLQRRWKAVQQKRRQKRAAEKAGMSDLVELNEVTPPLALEYASCMPSEHRAYRLNSIPLSRHTDWVSAQNYPYAHAQEWKPSMPQTYSHRVMEVNGVGITVTSKSLIGVVSETSES